MHDQTVTDYDIQALVDDELGYEEEKRVRLLMQSDPRIQKRYNELKMQKRLLCEWWHGGRKKS